MSTTTSRRDVQLVITAENKASRVVDGVAASLKILIDNQGALGRGAKLNEQQMSDLAKALAAVEKAYPGIDAAARKGEEAFNRQERSLKGNREELAALQKQLGEVAKAQDAMRSKIVDATLGGQDAAGLRERLKASADAGRAMESQAERLKGTIVAQEAALGKQRSTLQQLGSQANAVEQALTGVGTATQREMAKARAATEEVTRSLREQARAAKEQAQGDAARGRFDRFMGIGEDPRGRQAGKSASVFMEQDKILDDMVRRFREFGQQQNEAAAQAQKFRDALNPTAVTLRQVNEELKRAAELYKNGQLSVTDFIATQTRLNGEILKLRAAMDPATAQIERQKKATQDLAQFDRELAQAADQLRLRMDPLAAIQRNLNEQLRQAALLFRNGKLSAEEFANAQKYLKEQAEAAGRALERHGNNGKPGFMGLTPYAMQNLSYQINDVFTQLASGTSITQTLAQQGGQLIQIFPKVGDAIGAAFKSPPILAAAAALGLVLVTVNRLISDSQRLRTFEGTLERLESGAGYSAQAMVQLSRDMQAAGFSAEAAVKGLQLFASSGVRPELMESFAATALDVADVMGKDFDDALRIVSQGLTGTYDDVLRMQDALGVLTQADIDHIRVLYEEGRANEARVYAMQRVTEEFDTAADRARGPWTSAWRGLKSVWEDFIGSMARKLSTEFPMIMAALAALAARGEQVAERLRTVTPGATPGAAPNNAPQIAANQQVIQGLNQQIQTAQQQLAATERQLQNASAFLRPALQGQVNRLRGTIRNLEQTRAAKQQELQGLQRQVTDTRNATEQNTRPGRQAADAADKEIEILQLQQELNEATEERERIRLAGELEYRREMARSRQIEVAQHRRRVGEERERLRVRQHGIEEARRMAEREQREAERRAERERDRGIRDFPLPGSGRITHPFGERRGNRLHGGVDIAGSQGDPVALRVAGSVSRIANDPAGYGNYIIINHGNGTETLYGHLSRVMVEMGQDIAEGTVIGLVGGRPGTPGAGNSSGEHLHYEVRQNDQKVNPVGRFATDLEDAAEATDDYLERQAQFNVNLDQEIASRRIVIEQRQRLLGLSGEQLFNEERAQAVANAAREAQQNALRQEMSLDEDRLNTIKELAGREWDVANAVRRATQAVEDFGNQRNALLGMIRLLDETGESPEAAGALRNALDAINAQLDESIAGAIRFWQSMGDNPQARAAILALEQQRVSMRREQRDLAMSPLTLQSDRMQSLRSELTQQRDAMRDMGQMDTYRQITEQLRGLDRELLTVIDRTIEMLRVNGGPDAAAAIARWQNLRNEVAMTGQELVVTAGSLQDAFADNMVSSAEQWLEALTSGEDVLKSTWNGLLSFGAGFLRQVAQMIMQAAAAKAAMELGFGGAANAINGLFGVASAAPLQAAGATLTTASTTLATGATTLATGSATLATGATTLGTASLALGSGSATLAAAAVPWAATATTLLIAATMMAASGGGAMGGLFGNMASGFSPAQLGAGLFGFFHSGGIVGQTRDFRPAPLAAFRGAPRYHGGGIAGLKPDEMGAILRRGEEVLTEDNPRHRNNGGGKADVHLKNVILFEPGEMLSRGLSTRVGEQTLMTWVRRNSRAINTTLRNG